MCVYWGGGGGGGGGVRIVVVYKMGWNPVYYSNGPLLFVVVFLVIFFTFHFESEKLIMCAQ